MSSEVISRDGTYLQECTASSVPPVTCVVQLRYATLPRFLRAMAVHYWFVVFDLNARRWHRWEVWQTRNAGGQSIGHIHRDMRHPDCGVGGAPIALQPNGTAGQRGRFVPF